MKEAKQRGAYRELGLTERDLLAMYNYMVLARTISNKAWLLNRQGKIFFIMQCDGQEAASIGFAYALKPGLDFIFPYSRDFAAVLHFGLTPREIMLNFLARAEDPCSGGRQHPMHWGSRRLRIMSLSSPIGNPLTRGVGVALASKMKREPAVTVVCFGDGASSKGDFHEAANFAGIFKVPVIFFCENNGYSISVPQHKQMAIKDVSIRAQGYGFPGVTVDGLDVLAVYRATKEAAERARRGEGPTLIEAKTVRIGSHSSADDQTRYRSKEELEEVKARDPVPRFRAYLMEEGVLDEASDREIWARADAEVEEAIAYAESRPFPRPESALEKVYAP